jgi:hypothetical protein
MYMLLQKTETSNLSNRLSNQRDERFFWHGSRFAGHMDATDKRKIESRKHEGTKVNTCYLTDTDR